MRRGLAEDWNRRSIREDGDKQDGAVWGMWNSDGEEEKEEMEEERDLKTADPQEWKANLVFTFLFTIIKVRICFAFILRQISRDYHQINWFLLLL